MIIIFYTCARYSLLIEVNNFKPRFDCLTNDFVHSPCFILDASYL
jgi:hypothetical protein